MTKGGVAVLKPASWSKIGEFDLTIEGNENHHLTEASRKKLAQLCQNFFYQGCDPPKGTIKTEYNGIAFARSGRVISQGHRKYTVEVSADFSGIESVQFRIVGRYFNSKFSSNTPHYMRNIFSVFFTAILFQEEPNHEVRCAQKDSISP